MGRYVAGHLRGFVIGAVFAAVALGFAYSMPGAFNVSDQDVLPTPTVTETETPEPEPTPTESVGDPEDPAAEPSDDDVAKGNHGAAVSVAAHCPIKGRAHGRLVRSIARDKEATPGDAERACAEALAAEGTAETHANKGAKDEAREAGKGAGKEHAPGQTKKASKGAGVSGEDDSAGDSSEDDGGETAPASDKGNDKAKDEGGRGKP